MAARRPSAKRKAAPQQTAETPRPRKKAACNDECNDADMLLTNIVNSAILFEGRRAELEWETQEDGSLDWWPATRWHSGLARASSSGMNLGSAAFRAPLE